MEKCVSSTGSRDISSRYVLTKVLPDRLFANYPLQQTMETTAQPGSLDAEQGVFCSTFDKTGLRLITGEADKTIKVWKQDDSATEETHPLDWKPSLRQRKY